MVTSEWGAIYKELGAQPVINATGSVTLLGGSTPVPEVKEAMDRADSAFYTAHRVGKGCGRRDRETGWCARRIHHIGRWLGADSCHRSIHGRWRRRSYPTAARHYRSERRDRSSAS